MPLLIIDYYWMKRLVEITTFLTHHFIEDLKSFLHFTGLRHYCQMTEFFISLGTLFTEYQSIIIPYPFLPSLTCLLPVTSMPPPPPSTRLTMRWRHPTGHHIERVSIAPPRRNYATSRKPSLLQIFKIFKFSAIKFIIPPPLARARSWRQMVF